MSSEERRHVLDMLENGQITPSEAEKLLEALNSEESISSTKQANESLDSFKQTVLDHAEDVTFSTTPEIQFRRYWQIPFWVGIVLLVAAGWCVTTLAPILLQVCGWSFLGLGLIVLLLGWWSRSSRWVHIRVQEDTGTKFAISLPMPLGLFEIGLRAARRFVNDETAQNLTMASSMLDLMKNMETTEPLLIEVDDDDGDHIQVYFG